MSQRYETYLDTLEFATASRIGFNNSLNPTFLGEGFSISQTPSGTPGFVQDHPFIANGQSLGGSTGNIEYRYSEEVTANVIRSRNTFGFWFKLNQAPTATSLIFRSRGDGGASGLVDTTTVNINASRQLIYQNRTSAGGMQGIASSEVLNLNEWYFISFVNYNIRESATITRAYQSIMINGIVDIVGTNIIDTNLFFNRSQIYCDPRWNISEFIQGSLRFSTQNTARIYAAGIPDKQARQTILDSQPVIFYGTDIVNKTDLMPNLGSMPNTDINLNFSATQGNSITINQIGADDKGWTFYPSATRSHNSVQATSGPAKDALNTGIQSTFVNSDAVSFEFWYQVQEVPLNSSADTIRLFVATANPSSADYLPFLIETRNISPTSNTNVGHINVSLPYPGTSSMQTGGLSSTVNNRNRIRFDDGQWHHCVVTFTKKTPSTTHNRGDLYIDGILVQFRNYSTINWGTYPINQLKYESFTFFSDQILTVDGWQRSIDSFIMYDRALTSAEIKDHYYAWLNQPNVGPTNPVRYWDGDSWNDSSAQKVWNGTAWVDWNASYWNGTQWTQLVA